MEILPLFLPLLTIAMVIGLPILLLIQLFNKKSILIKIPSLKIWKNLIKTIGNPPKTKLNILNLSFLAQLIILCLLAYLCSAPFLLKESKSRPVFNILINRSTSMSAKSEPYISRWERLKKTLFNQLLENGMRSDDMINLYLNPPLNSIQQEISLNQLDKILNEIELVDLPPIDNPFYSMAKDDAQNIYVTDSISEIPDSLKEKFFVIYIKDNEHINVGWLNFWIEDQTVNGVLKNFSDYSLNVNIDIKINNVSIQANDFAPAIKPKESFLFRKIIQEDFKNINLIEISVACPGDALEADNLISLSRLQTQKLKVLVASDVPIPITKALRAIGDKIEITQGELSDKTNYEQFELMITGKFINLLKINQLIVNPIEGNSFFQFLDGKINNIGNSTQWLNSNEQKMLENVMFENIKELKESSLSLKLLVDHEKGWPIIARWKNENNAIYLVNFDCSEKASLVHTPLFPFLIAKLIDEMNYNDFHYFKTGDIIEESNISSKQTKVFQPNRKGSASLISFNNSDLVMLKHAGIYSNENINICVNLLNENESNIKQTSIGNQSSLNFTVKKEQLPIDLKPYIVGLILLILAFEWIFSKKENLHI